MHVPVHDNVAVFCQWASHVPIASPHPPTPTTATTNEQQSRYEVYLLVAALFANACENIVFSVLLRSLLASNLL